MYPAEGLSSVLSNPLPFQNTGFTCGTVADTCEWWWVCFKCVMCFIVLASSYLWLATVSRDIWPVPLVHRLAGRYLILLTYFLFRRLLLRLQQTLLSVYRLEDHVRPLNCFPWQLCTDKKWKYAGNMARLGSVGWLKLDHGKLSSLNKVI